jgi:hypothetical protein
MKKGFTLNTTTILCMKDGTDAQDVDHFTTRLETAQILAVDIK